MTLTVQIKIPQNAGAHEAQVKCSTDDYKHANVLAPGDELTVHVHAANEVHISEVPAGTKSARLAAASAPIALPVIDPGTDSLEREIQAKADKAPRVTPADIEAEIASEHYFTARDGRRGALHEETYVGREKPAPDNSDLLPLDLLTFCVLVLKNGFTVTGESACASPENFNAEIGRRIARENAIAKVWPLMGYELRSKLAA